jgi:hypothetical protein
MRYVPVVLLLTTAVTLAAVFAASGQRDSDDNTIHVVLPRDAIPAVFKPEFESVESPDRQTADDELMIGVVGEREQRAFPSTHVWKR